MKKIVLYTSLILITAIVISNPGRTLVYASESLKICYEIIIPSLFPFASFFLHLPAFFSKYPPPEHKIDRTAEAETRPDKIP